MFEVDLDHRPIPEAWGLYCPACAYPLCGLVDDVCPECGEAFDLFDMLQPWSRLREPVMTGAERPVPDFGLACARCGVDISGMRGDACEHCLTPLEQSLVPPRPEWFVIQPWMHPQTPLPVARMALEEAFVPLLPGQEAAVLSVHGGTLTTVLQAHRDFYFDVLFVLREAQHETAARRELQGEWTCPDCGEENPASFDACWNCAVEGNGQHGATTQSNTG